MSYIYNNKKIENNYNDYKQNINNKKFLILDLKEIPILYKNTKKYTYDTGWIKDINPTNSIGTSLILDLKSCEEDFLPYISIKNYRKKLENDTNIYIHDYSITTKIFKIQNNWYRIIAEENSLSNFTPPYYDTGEKYFYTRIILIISLPKNI